MVVDNASDSPEFDIVNDVEFETYANGKPWRHVFEEHGDSEVKVWKTDMVVGIPYSHVLFGVPIVAIKRSSGAVDFYRVPEE